jgi:subtilisin family serine protease
LTQLLPRNCDGYNYAAARGVAVAVCYPSSLATVEVGPVDGELAPAPGIPGRDAGTAIAYASQDEDRIYFATVNSQDVEPFVIDVYRRQPDDSWLVDPALGFRSTNPTARLGAIAFADGHDRAIVVDGAVLTEYVIDPGWTPVLTMSSTELGADIVSGFSMTADGRRATFYVATQTTTGQYYTDRPSVDDAFRRGDPLDVSSYPAAFMTDDCGRIYVSGVGSIFYAKQAR